MRGHTPQTTNRVQNLEAHTPQDQTSAPKGGRVGQSQGIHKAASDPLMNSARLKLRLPWKTRRGLVIWITSGFLVPTLYLAWHIFGWPEPIRISDETTRLTEPLTEDGYVDYIHCFRSQLRRNNDDYVNDPWLALLRNEEEARLPARLHQKRPQPPGASGIVYREPVEFYREMLDEDPNSVTGYERLRVYETEVMDGRLRRPFSTIDDPAAATAIAANAAWYRAISPSRSDHRPAGHVATGSRSLS